MIKQLILLDKIRSLNIFVPHIRASNYMKHKLIELQKETDKSTIIVGDFNTPLSIIDRTSRQKVIKNIEGASLVAQWLRICLPMQGTRVQALVWEDPTCCGATKPVSHSY